MSLGLDSHLQDQPMSIDEFVALVHLVNLVVCSMYDIALNFIVNKLEKLGSCSDLFKGNLARIHALCLQLKV